MAAVVHLPPSPTSCPAGRAPCGHAPHPLSALLATPPVATPLVHSQLCSPRPLWPRPSLHSSPCSPRPRTCGPGHVLPSLGTEMRQGAWGDARGLALQGFWEQRARQLQHHVRVSTRGSRPAPPRALGLGDYTELRMAPQARLGTRANLAPPPLIWTSKIQGVVDLSVLSQLPEEALQLLPEVLLPSHRGCLQCQVLGVPWMMNSSGIPGSWTRKHKTSVSNVCDKGCSH
jgi:hypothetical protein